MSVNSIVVQNSETTLAEKKENSAKVTNWMVAIGIGVTAAIGVTAVVYYAKKRKDGARRPYRKETIDNYSSKLNRYWGFAVQTFHTVRDTVSSFLNKPEVYQPLVANGVVNAMRSEDEEVVVPEQDL